MDDDIRLAVQIHADDHGIHDVHLVEKLFEEFKANNYDTIEDIINNNYDTNILDVNPNHLGIDFTAEGLGHVANIQEINQYRNIDVYETIGDREQNQIRTQMNLNSANPGLNVNNPLGSILQQFLGLSNIDNVPISGDNNNFQYSMSNNNGNIQYTVTGGSNIGVPSLFGNLMNAFMGNIPLNQEPVRVTLTEEALNNLKDHSYNEVLDEIPDLDKEEKCAICWEKLSEQIEELKDYKVLPCKHVFHSVCITEELENYSYLCPTCKSECGDHEAKIDN